MYEQLIELIEQHQNYGPAVRDAASRKARLVLNYHTHGPGTGFCVSICMQQTAVLPVFGQALPMEELAHIRGIGKTEEQCLPLMQPLAEQLSNYYGLEVAPEIYLNGNPVEESDRGPSS
jgi:hypothetical protein